MTRIGALLLVDVLLLFATVSVQRAAANVASVQASL
jgi:hypothetical protein